MCSEELFNSYWQSKCAYGNQNRKLNAVTVCLQTGNVCGLLWSLAHDRQNGRGSFQGSETMFSVHDIADLDFLLSSLFWASDRPVRHRRIKKTYTVSHFISVSGQYKKPGNYRESSSPDNTLFPTTSQLISPPCFDATESRVHILQCQTTVTEAHMMSIGTIKEQTTVTHDHNLLIWVYITWDCITSHALYQFLYMFLEMFVITALCHVPTFTVSAAPLLKPRDKFRLSTKKPTF